MAHMNLGGNFVYLEIKFDINFKEAVRLQKILNQAGIIISKEEIKENRRIFFCKI
jgi:hypothetical protein